MNMDLLAMLIPFEGLSDIKLYQNISLTKKLLEESRLDYYEEIWSDDTCTIPDPWTLLHIEDRVTLFFSNDKLFKITTGIGYKGKLPNEISIGMTLEEALTKDADLSFDEWNEDYKSPSGYWVEDDPVTHQIISISIFIKETEDDDFEEHKW